MRVGDLVKLMYGFVDDEENYYALVVDHWASTLSSDKWTFLFLDDGTTEEYNQEAFDYEEIGVEVISESR